MTGRKSDILQAQSTNPDSLLSESCHCTSRGDNDNHILLKTASQRRQGAHKTINSAMSCLVKLGLPK